jgi:hypothetical protein
MFRDGNRATGSRFSVQELTKRHEYAKTQNIDVPAGPFYG